MGKPYKLVLYGATGFTGRLCAHYLSTVPDLQGQQWAIAGRTEDKLQALASELQHPPGLDVLTVPLTDAAATDALVKSADAIINCAGPFSQYHGEQLLGSCARNGVHYSDLSGESWWQATMAAKFHDEAA
jgi:short subunit dehydrogenase-like uncharacterized protein